MFLKRMLIAGILALGLSTAQADDSVVVEMAWGIGGTEMPSNGIFLRLRHDKLEAHVGQWFGSAGEKNVVGLGYITQADKLTWTPGIAYMKGRDLVMFSRFAYEMPVSETGAFEVGLLGYGTYDELGETFATVAFKVGNNTSFKEDNDAQNNTNENGDVGDTGDGSGSGGSNGDDGNDGDSSDNGDSDGSGTGSNGGDDSGGDNGGSTGGDGDSDGGGDNGNGKDGDSDGDSNSNDGEGDNGGDGETDGDVGDSDNDNNQCDRPGHGYGDTNQTHCFVPRR